MRKIKVVIFNYQADCSFHLWYDVWFGDFQTQSNIMSYMTTMKSGAIKQHQTQTQDNYTP